MSRFSMAAISLCGAAALFVAIPVLAEDMNAALPDWVSTEWEIRCLPADGSGDDPCEGQDTAAVLFEEYLEGASAWFEELGFPGPKITSSLGKYQAWIIREKDAIGPDGEPFSGLYNPTEHMLFLNEKGFFAMGEEGQTFESPEFGVATSFMLTAVHELFHGIQESYPNNICGERRGWMCEGMADAAMRAYHDRFESELNVAMDRRGYGVPLHEPGKKEWKYGTWQFWLDIGRHIISLVYITYFQQVMTKHASGNNNGLLTLEEALKAHDGLYELLPWFFTQRNPDVDFGEPLRRDVQLKAGQHEVEKQISDIVVQAVAGRAVKLKILHDTDKAISVKIAFEPSDDDLHLIVDNRRYDKSEGSDRNVFFVVRRDNKPLEFDVVIANVAKRANLSGENKVGLHVQVRSEHASMGVDVDGGGIADAINTPLPIRLDKYQVQVRAGDFVEVAGTYVGKGYAEGIVNPCFMNLTGYAAREPGRYSPIGLTINLQTSGPITPGKYPIVDPLPGSAYSEKFPPGEAVAGAGVRDLPDGENDMQFASGYLTIDSVRGGMVSGSILGVGVHKEYSTVTGRDEVVETLTLGARFSILAGSAFGAYTDKPYACLKSEKP